VSSPLSPAVLGGAALISGPALYDAFVVGSLPPGAAALRFLVAAAVVWGGLALVAALVSATSPGPRAQQDPLPALPDHMGAPSTDAPSTGEVGAGSG
jgi:hypothetical protein